MTEHERWHSKGPRKTFWGLPLGLMLACLFGLSSRAAASLYEQERLTKVLMRHQLSLASDAEGKQIQHVHIVREDVFVKDEFWPTFFNVFHALTRENTVRRDLLLEEGATYQQALADETVRTLKGRGTYALVVVVPVCPNANPACEEVDLLVYTRDLWSLRFETGFSVTGDVVDKMALTLVERNLFGKQVTAAIHADFVPKMWSMGASFGSQRFLDSRHELNARVDVRFSRDTNKAEGSRGSIEWSLPLWDLKPRWGFEVDASWDYAISRQLSGQDFITWDNPDTDDVEAIERQWRSRTVQMSALAMRQTGRSMIARWGLGLNWRSSEGALLDETRAQLHEDSQAAFEADVLPLKRHELSPVLSATFFEPRWVNFYELSAYGLTEHLRIGPTVSFRLATPLEAFGSTRDALSYSFSLSWIFAPEAMGDRALIELAYESEGRLEAAEFRDQRYRFLIRGATPRLGFGRFAFFTDLAIRHADSSNTLVTLGGDNGLRGYASQTLYGFGANRLRASLEWRSPVWVLGSIHLGGVTFYDLGALGTSSLEVKHSVGIGLRMLLPQFNRYTFRADLGVPLEDSGFSVLFGFGSTQSIPLSADEDARVSSP